MSRKKAKQRSKAIEAASSALKEKSSSALATIDAKAVGAKIKEAFQAERYRDALNEWLKIPDAHRPAALTPLIAEAHFRLGLDCYRNPSLSPEKRFNQIVSELSQATTINAEKAIYHFHLGLAYEHLRNLKKARVSYRRAVELDSKSERFLFHYVMACMKSEQSQMAMEMLPAGKTSFIASFGQFLLRMKQGRTPSFAELNGIDFPKPDEGALFKGLLSLSYNLVDQASYYFESSLDAAEESAHSLVTAFSAFFLGKIHFQSRNKSRYDQMLKMAVDNGLDNERYRPWLLNYCWQKGVEAAKTQRLEESRRYFEQMLMLAPEHEGAQKNLQRLHFLAANQLAHTGNWQEALTIWQMKCAREDRNVFHNVALAYNKLENPEKANIHWQQVAEHYEKLCRSHPGDSMYKEYLIVAYQHLLRNYRESGNDSRAVKALQKLCDLQPENLEQRLELAETLVENGRWSSARRQLEHILHRQPNHLDALMVLAFVQEMSDEVPQAIGTLEKVLSLDANNKEAREQLGDLLSEEAHDLLYGNREIERAGALFDRLMELNPDDFHGYMGWAKIHVHEQDGPDAIDRIFKRYIETGPDDPIVHLNVANAYLEFDMSRKAKTHIDQAEEMAGDDAELLLELGKALYGHSPGQSERFFKRALHFSPDDAEFYFQLGSWMVMRDPWEAKKYLEKCLRIDDSHLSARTDLALVYSLLGDRKKAEENMLRARQIADVANDPKMAKELAAMNRMLDNQMELFTDDFFDDEP